MGIFCYVIVLSPLLLVSNDLFDLAIVYCDLSTVPRILPQVNRRHHIPRLKKSVRLS